MRTSIAGLAGLLALLAGCGGGSRELAYGAAQAPTLAEQDAAAAAQVQLDAQARLSAGTGVAPSGQPTAAGPGLADQLAATLGGDAAPDPAAPQLLAAGDAVAALPAGTPAPFRRAVGRAVALPGAAAVTGPALDPACVTIGLTSVTWSGCVLDYAETDPLTQDTVTMHATIDGRLDWSPATGRTTWRITEVLDMTMTFDGAAMQSDATVVLTGDVTSAAGAIVGQTASTADVTARYMGVSVSQGLRTTMDLDLTHAAEPFCITGGTLTLEQVWTRLPAGASRTDYPDQGWRFEWTGCGQFTVAHGS